MRTARLLTVVYRRGLCVSPWGVSPGRVSKGCTAPPPQPTGFFVWALHGASVQCGLVSVVSRGVLVFLNFQKFREHQILWSLCSVVFHTLTLKLPIQTLLSVVPELPVSLSPGE